MPSDLHDPAQDHINAIFTVMQYIASRVPKQFDYEMEREILKLQVTFDRYRSTHPPVEGEIDFRFSDCLASNYTIVQCSVLLAFANAVAVLAETHGISVLKDPLAQLWAEMAHKYAMFFNEAPTAD